MPAEAERAPTIAVRNVAHSATVATPVPGSLEETAYTGEGSHTPTAARNENFDATQLFTSAGDADRRESINASSQPSPRSPQLGSSVPGMHGQSGSSAADNVPEQLGGYRIIERIGAGGMGSVYRAQQLSLDRPVALKVMASKIARNPIFVARFCREAYAAAQLVHHNMVQIYDFGEQNGTHYFSMEFVDGKTLDELISKDGPLDPISAAGYIVQAARGLKLAHDNGLVHRDIKPSNLMIDRHGMVKVADLGLVKAVGLIDPSEPKQTGADLAAAEGSRKPSHAHETPTSRAEALDSSVTRADIAMGTPACMAPEQARDAAHVDSRADIYSLGCTLYTLVTGRPPFEGKSAVEVLTKHAQEPVIPPEVLVKDTPEALSKIILKMVAKDPNDRYASLDEVIAALEGFLKLPAEDPTAANPESASLLEQGLRALGGARTKQKSFAFIVLAAACVVGFILALIGGQAQLAGGLVGVAALTPLAYLVLGEVAGRTPLFRRARQFILESTKAERIAIGAGFVLLLAVLLLMGILGTALAVAVMSLALAATARFILEPRRPKSETLGGMLEAVKELRRRGVDEGALRDFVAKRAGPRFEAVREALFGSDDRMTALRDRGRAEWARARSGLAAWRDTVSRWVESRVRAREEARVKKHLEHVEEENLKAQGLNLDAACKKARQAAEAMVTQARHFGKAGLQATMDLSAAMSTEEGRKQLARSLHDAAERPEQILRSLERGLLARRSDESLSVLLGSRTRFIAGVVLVIGFLLWGAQNAWGPKDTVGRPLQLPLIPGFITSPFQNANPAVMGLLFIASALIPGWRIAVPLIIAAAVGLIGPVIALPAWFWLMVALAIAAFGFHLSRGALDNI